MGPEKRAPEHRWLQPGVVNDDLWTERCDICGKALDRLKNEDFYDEVRGLDNRRRNLRVTTRSENLRNWHESKGRSGYRGVIWDSSRQCWRSRIWVGGRAVFLGSFDNELDAARAYDRAAIQHFGPDARVNLPKSTPSTAKGGIRNG